MSITVEELAQARVQLERNIARSLDTLLSDFQTRTGVPVDDLVVRLTTVRHIGNPKPVTVVGQVSVDIRV